jgi:hypothetical protein
MIAFFAFLVSLLGATINVAMYAGDQNPWSLGAAVFCGGCAVFNLVMAVNE